MNPKVPNEPKSTKQPQKCQKSTNCIQKYQALLPSHNDSSGSAVPRPKSYHAAALQMVLLLSQYREEGENEVKINGSVTIEIASIYICFSVKSAFIANLFISTYFPKMSLCRE